MLNGSTNKSPHIIPWSSKCVIQLSMILSFIEKRAIRSYYTLKAPPIPLHQDQREKWLTLMVENVQFGYQIASTSRNQLC